MLYKQIFTNENTLNAHDHCATDTARIQTISAGGDREVEEEIGKTGAHVTYVDSCYKRVYVQ